MMDQKNQVDRKDERKYTKLGLNTLTGDTKRSEKSMVVSLDVAFNICPLEPRQIEK